MNSVSRVWCVSVGVSVALWSKNFVLCLCVCSVLAAAACWSTVDDSLIGLGGLYLSARYSA